MKADRLCFLLNQLSYSVARTPSTNVRAVG